MRILIIYFIYRDDILFLYNKIKIDDLSYRICESVKSSDLYKLINYALQDLINIYTTDEQNKSVDFILI